MSDIRRPDDLIPHSGDDIDEILAGIKARLEQTSAWPETAQPLVRRVTKAGAPISDDDEEMLSLVIDDFTKGVDIRERYPAFFERLLENVYLRTAFLEILELVAEEAAESPETAFDIVPNLEFLTHSSSEPKIIFLESGWQVVWQLTANYLTSLFSPRIGEPVRSGDLLEDPWFILIRSDLEIDRLIFQVILEATQNIDHPDKLNLQLSVFNAAVETADLPPLEATLSWINYRRQILLTSSGLSRFPEIALQEILDPETGEISGDIALSLRPAG